MGATQYLIFSTGQIRPKRSQCCGSHCRCCSSCLPACLTTSLMEGKMNNNMLFNMKSLPIVFFIIEMVNPSLLSRKHFIMFWGVISVEKDFKIVQETKNSNNYCSNLKVIIIISFQINKKLWDWFSYQIRNACHQSWKKCLVNFQWRQAFTC